MSEATSLNTVLDIPELFAVERFMPFRFSVLGGQMTRALGRIYTETFRLSAPEWRVLAVLGRFGAMAPNDLSDRTAMDKVRVSKTISSLMRRGYVVRESDPVDRRRAILKLTSSGDTIYQDITPRVLAAETQILASLTAEEREALSHVISKLERQMEQVTFAEDEP